MVKLQRRPFGEPDSVREVPFGHLETYDMGEIRIGRSILQPGWRWSESIKPITRTELCEYHHIGVCLSGRMRIQTREGAELTVDAGQFYEIPAGHEAWVEGDEPYINIEWQPSVAFGEAQGGDFDRIVATLLVTDIVNSTARALELGDGAWRDLLAQHDRGGAEPARPIPRPRDHDHRRRVRRPLRRRRAGDPGGAGDLSCGVGARHRGSRGRAHRRDRAGGRQRPRRGRPHRGADRGRSPGPGEVYASWATRELLAGSDIGFTDRGRQELKGLSEERRVYLVG